MTIGACATGCGGSSGSFGSRGTAPSAPSLASEPAGGFDEAPAQASPAEPGGSFEARGAEASRSRFDDGSLPAEEADRPGLGTAWGETRFSRISSVSFTRADPDGPFAKSALFYNDEDGARAMAQSAGFERFAGGPVRVAGGAVTVGLRDGSGRFLSGYVAGGRSFVVGDAGDRYTIVLQNRTSSRFEVVLSVDGLDVLDGREASIGKRGYLIDPHGELEVDGFRQSSDAVAAFRFGSVRGSYASQKHGDTRNVGVIGVALFHERGDDPFAWTSREVDRRTQADPFPGRFASPPR